MPARYGLAAASGAATVRAMVTWSEFATAEPAFAGRVQQLLDAGKHKTIATVRADGSPRISGIECNFEDGDLWLGMMPGSLKAADALRDPRVAIHSASEDSDGTAAWPGDAKVAGRLVEVTDAAQMHRMQGQPGHLFRLDITEVSTTRLGDPADHLLIEAWSPERGLRRIKRA
jgi:hypothetical protein